VVSLLRTARRDRLWPNLPPGVGVKDCPISGDKPPLVVVSHGWGGSFANHHDLAETLADAGFVVAAVTHPLDRAPDGSLTGGLPDFVERPTDIERLIDFVLGASPAASRIDPQRIGFFGFSFGGYTGLVLLGAGPDWVGDGCTGSSTAPVCERILREKLRVQPLPHDLRIKAAIIADPRCLWFTPDGFAAVTVPVQLWVSERATQWEGIPMPSAATVAAVFICPPAAVKATPEVCTDAPGFDRVAFHQQFDADVLAFFLTHLTKAPRP
jgi:predicted dienelactone hydrolase